MRKLNSTFEDVFGIPFSVIQLPEYELLPIFGSADSALLFGSASAVKRPILVQLEILYFEEYCPSEYFLLGFWGHGVNTYAFYYSRSDEWSKVCFRLPYGGVYMNNNQAATDIAQFLLSYFTFERQLIGSGYHLIAIDSMWEGRYKIETPEGKQIEYEGSLLESADFTCLGHSVTSGAARRGARLSKETSWTMKPEEIRRLRQNLEWTQEELAEVAFVKPEEVYEWEEGISMPSEEAQAILEILNEVKDKSQRETSIYLIVLYLDLSLKGNDIYIEYEELENLAQYLYEIIVEISFIEPEKVYEWEQDISRSLEEVQGILETIKNVKGRNPKEARIIYCMTLFLYIWLAEHDIHIQYNELKDWAEDLYNAVILEGE